jgi:hypothetical protein
LFLIACSNWIWALGSVSEIRESAQNLLEKGSKPPSLRQAQRKLGGVWRESPSPRTAKRADVRLFLKYAAIPNLTLSREQRYQNLNAKSQSRKDFFGLLLHDLAFPPILSRKGQTLGVLAALR